MKNKKHVLIWIILLAVLLVTSVVRFEKGKERTELENCGHTLIYALRAVTDFTIAHDGRFPATIDELPAEYKCPLSGKKYRFRNADDWKVFEVYCEGGYHMPLSREPDYPRYGVAYPEGPQLTSNPYSAMNSRHFEL